MIVWVYWALWSLIKFPGPVHVFNHSEHAVNTLRKKKHENGSLWSAIPGVLFCLQTDTNTPCKQALVVMTLLRFMHVILHNPPLVLSFLTDLFSQFFQHHICLTVLLKGLKVRNSQLIPIGTWVAIKARDTGITVLRAFSEGWLEVPDTRSTSKPGNLENNFSNHTHLWHHHDNTDTDKIMCPSDFFHIYIIFTLHEIYLKALHLISFIVWQLSEQ